MLALLRRFFATRRRIVASPSQRPAVRLRLEELEHRWVPSGITTTSSTNWAGYAVNTGAGAVTAVSGSWTVPTVTGTAGETTYSSAWVGIDGFSSTTVEQTGTEMDVTSSGKAEYSAWYELYPSDPVTINMTVKPGDQMSASVTYSSGEFTLTIKDADGNQSYTTHSAYSSAEQLSSAEWIAEAPSSNRGVLPLANFGAVTFSNATATINGVTGAIDHAWSGATAYLINLANSQAKATTSGLTDSSGASGFTVAFGAGTPATPPPTTPPTPPPTTPPPTSTGTTTTLTATANSHSRTPSATFVAVIADAGGALPTGTVEVMDGTTVIGTVQIENVHGVAEAVFTVTFPRGPGVYNISVVYPGSGSVGGSTSNTITVTVN